MAGSVTGFLVYISAMLGVIFIALIVVKKTLNFNADAQKNNFLKVESRLTLEPRKNLYVIKAGKERFLIASGIEGCRFMTKIEDYGINDFVGIPETTPEIPSENPVYKIKIPAINIGGT